MGRDLEVLPIVSKEYDQTNDVVRHAAVETVVDEAARRGFVEPVPLRSELPPGQWKRFAGTWLRFDTYYREGSASFQQYGSLRVSCRKPTGDDDGRVAVAENEGERAVAFAADDSDVIAVGFVEADGGEGSSYYNTAYVLADACP